MGKITFNRTLLKITQLVSFMDLEHETRFLVCKLVLYHSLHSLIDQIALQSRKDTKSEMMKSDYCKTPVERWELRVYLLQEDYLGLNPRFSTYEQIVLFFCVPSHHVQNTVNIVLQLKIIGRI